MAVDLGGTNLKGAVVAVDGVVQYELRRSTPEEGALEATLEAGLELARAARAEGRLVGVALAVPGVVDEARGVVRFAANLGWRDVALGDLARERLGVAAAVLHDVRAAALAEGRLGAARECSDFLLVTLGTGVGAAVVLNGRPYVGAHGTGGELGHTTVDPRGPRCGCGRRGCLEAFASAGHLARRYEARSGRAAGADEVAARAADGDPVAEAVWAEAVEALAAALADYALLLDPELVVIGGGMAAAGEALFGPLRRSLASSLPFGSRPCVVPAALGPDAGQLGAALAAFGAAGVGLGELSSWRR